MHINFILSFIGGLGGWEVLLILLFFALPAVLWIWALVDLLQSNFSDSTNKIIWAIVIVMLPFMGHCCTCLSDVIRRYRAKDIP